MLLLLLQSLQAQQQRGHGAACDPNTRLVFQVPEANLGALTPDGRTIVSALSNGTIAIWDISTGKVLRQLGVNISEMVNIKLSPDGAYLCALTLGPVMIVSMAEDRIITHMDQNISSVAWSPDSLRIVTCSVAGSCHIRDPLSGRSIIQLPLEDPEMSDVSWYPAEMIATVHHDGLSMYHSNGSLAQKVPLSGGSFLRWGPRSILAVWGDAFIKLFGIDGEELVSQPFLLAVEWGGDGDLVAGCNVECGIYEATSLKLLMNVNGPYLQNIIAFSPDQSILVTEIDGLYVWNVQTPGFRSVPDEKQIWKMDWVDRDQLLVLHDPENSSLLTYQVNVRFQLMEAYLYEGGFDANNTCVIKDEIYHVNKSSGFIHVFAYGEERRRWGIELMSNSSELLMFCARENFVALVVNSYSLIINNNNINNNYHNSNHNNVEYDDQAMIVVFNRLGQNQFNFSSSYRIKQLAMVNASRIAVISVDYSLFLWDPLTSRANISAGVAHDMGWSPDGWWLYSRFRGEWKICNPYGQVRYQGVGLDGTNNQNAHLSFSWSSDSSLLLISTASKAFLISPQLRMTSMEGWLWYGRVAWNPEALEYAFEYSNTIRVQVVIPVLHKLITEQVGKTTSLTMKAGGAKNLDGIVMMIRWVSPSTSEPQCLFIHPDLVDTWTLSAVVRLDEPTAYSLYFAFPTGDTCKTWLGGDNFSFSVPCTGDSYPAFNRSGGLTTCICPEFMYADPTADGECNDCPRYGICDGTSRVLSERGFWPVSGLPVRFLACAPQACPGNNTCAPFYEGLVCGYCQKGAGQHGFGRCQRCQGIGLDMVWVCFGFFCWVGLCVIQSLFALGWKSSPRKGNNSVQLAAIFLSTVQVNAMLLSVNVNSSSLWLFEGSAHGGIDTAAFSCVVLHFGAKPGQVHYIKQVLMLVLPIFAMGCLQILRWCLRKAGTLTSVDIVRIPTVITWVSLQSFLNTSLFQTLACRDVHLPTLQHGMSHDLSVACYSPGYWAFISTVTVPAIVMTMVLIPLRITWLLRYRPTADKSGHLRFLVKTYRTEWWFLVIFLRKLVLSAVVILSRNPLYVSCVLLIACVVHITVFPSTSHLVNVAETVSLLASVFIFAAAGALGLSTSDFATYDKGLEILIGVASLSYVFQLGLLLYDRYSTKNSEHDDAMDEEKIVLQRVSDAALYSSINSSILDDDRNR